MTLINTYLIDHSYWISIVSGLAFILSVLSLRSDRKELLNQKMKEREDLVDEIVKIIKQSQPEKELIIPPGIYCTPIPRNLNLKQINQLIMRYDRMTSKYNIDALIKREKELVAKARKSILKVK